MSETALTLIKSAMRLSGIIGGAETPSADETEAGLEALKILLREWSADNIMVYSQSQDTLTMTGATYYTIGSGGDLNTAWPVQILGGVLDGDYTVKVVGPGEYRRFSTSETSSDVCVMYYNAIYPLGKLYPWPKGGTTLVIDSLKALSEPTAITSSVAFPVGYDAAIKFNLAQDLASEWGRPISAYLERRALETKRAIQSTNFARQINAVQVDLAGGGIRYDIDQA